MANHLPPGRRAEVGEETFPGDLPSIRRHHPLSIVHGDAPSAQYRRHGRGRLFGVRHFSADGAANRARTGGERLRGSQGQL